MSGGMDLWLRIQTPERITTERVIAFLQALRSKRYLDDTTIERIKDMPIENFSSAIDLIQEHGVDGLSIAFSFENHYESEGRPQDTNHFTGIMYSLNIAAGEVAAAFGEEIKTDFYLDISFNNTQYQNEYGDAIQNFGLRFSEEGGYLDEGNFSQAADIVLQVMAKDYPPFVELLDLMKSHFGEVILDWEYNEF